ncbi:MAG: UDP-glucose 4-epimerase GalE [Corynebacteriales bacterium]|nr:UDP-glucose 4-epimerase GalE [Mycobacteriales bacterium]
MKLLVTGGAGYIGSVVTHALLDAGHTVTVLDDLSTGHIDNVPSQAEFIKGDIANVGSVLTPEFDGVLHFAARIAAGESVVKPELYWDTNVRGSLALLEAVRHCRTARLVFSSTAAVYGSSDTAITENTPTGPTNPYGASKLAVDMMITGECGASGLGAVSLRYFNAAGAVTSNNRLLGERHDPETHLIPIAIEAAAGARPALQMFGDDYDTPDGTCVRDYIHVSDLAEAHLLALNAATPGEHKIYNLGTGHGYSNKQVVDVIRAVTGRELPVTMAPRREGDAVTVVAAADKAREELNWKPRKGKLEDIIADAWSFYQNFQAK